VTNGATARHPGEASNLQLIVVQGDPAGACIDVNEEGAIVGRDPRCDLILHDLFVSRFHCGIWKTAGRYFVLDLHSTNSTCVNGRSVFRAEVFEGDELQLGVSQLRLLTVEDAVELVVAYARQRA
jgi:pSer/pThr/pTyr-binding forkhead associated (FHA) protein